MANREAVGQQFQQVLGRTATPAELDYLTKFLDEGSIQPHEVGQLLQATPEYQNTLLQQNTQAFGQQLNQQNEAILGQAAAQANSKFAGLGRPVTSAQGASVMQAGGQLAQQRQSALADFYGRGLQQNAGLAAASGQTALARGYGLRDATRQRNWATEDYYRMQNDQQNAQNAHSGWNAITPEFLVSQGIRGAAAVGTAGMSELFRRQQPAAPPYYPGGATYY